MEYQKLGNTGTDVSKIALGCMGFGDPARHQHKWTIQLEDARPIVKHALELGINYFDTADYYARGSSEEILGQCLREMAKRDEYVLQTKVDQPMREGPNGSGASRKHLIEGLNASLKRLGVDYVDVYLLHRWDDKTPIEETMETLNDLVRAGKVLYIGCSTMKTWQFQKAVSLCERKGWARPVVMQPHYNLIYREEENEMIPFCKDAGIAINPYSSLAGGMLTHPFGEQPNARSKVDGALKVKYGSTAEIDKPIIDRVEELAKRYGVKMATIALAWHLAKGSIPNAGAEKIDLLDDYVKALDVKLTVEDVAYLEEPYQHHGFINTNHNTEDKSQRSKLGIK